MQPVFSPQGDSEMCYVESFFLCYYCYYVAVADDASQLCGVAYVGFWYVWVLPAVYALLEFAYLCFPRGVVSEQWVLLAVCGHIVDVYGLCCGEGVLFCFYFAYVSVVGVVVYPECEVVVACGVADFAVCVSYVCEIVAEVLECVFLVFEA